MAFDTVRIPGNFHVVYHPGVDIANSILKTIDPVTQRVAERNGCNFFAYSWKLPPFCGASYLQLIILVFFLTVGAFSLTVLAFLLTVGAFFCMQWESACNRRLKGL